MLNIVLILLLLHGSTSAKYISHKEPVIYSSELYVSEHEVVLLIIFIALW